VVIDLSFRAIGMEVLAREWPAFAGGAAIQVYLAKRAHRSSHYRIQWIVFCASVAVIGIASMGVESTLVSERLHRDIGEGDRRRRRSHGHLADRDVAIYHSASRHGVACLPGPGHVGRCRVAPRLFGIGTALWMMTTRWITRRRVE
jgi:hypothetical protein